MNVNGSPVSSPLESLQVADDPDRLHERFGVVEDAFVVEPDYAAGGVAVRRVDLDRLQLVRELGIAVRLPALDVRRPGDQHVAVPEADRLAEPARHVRAEARDRAAQIERAADVDVRDEVVGVAGHDLHELRRHEHAVRLVRDAVVVPAAHETLGPAVLRRPLRRVRDRVVVELLHQARLIFLASAATGSSTSD